jgi:fatty-acid desaturase
VNSAAHLWGSRPYATRDGSRNLWWVGLLAFGEGWHNNHHAFPFSARHGLRWFEVDLTWYVIGALAKLGLARKVRLPTAAMMSRLATRPASSRS